MTAMDVAIVSGYLVLTLLVGLGMARRRTGAQDFFVAGRSMHWLPIGLSITLTAFSGINYIAFSGEVFSQGLYVALSLPVFVFVAIPVVRVIMPFYHQLGVCSAYEYLERRFDGRVRRLASGLFILWRVFWMATALYVPARILALLTGLNVVVLILLTGAVVTFYTAAGGIRAVIWSDVFQFVVLVGGLFIVIGLAARQMPEGLTGMLQTAAAGGLLQPFYPFDPEVLSFDPRIRITLWSSWIGTFTAFLARYGVDQVVVQRYFTARTLRTAQVAFHLNYAAAIVALLCLALLGLAMYAHAAAAGMLPLVARQPMAGFTMLISALPVGTIGLVLAGLLAATMSSIDSGINSCCTAFVTDFYHGRQPAAVPLAPRIIRSLSIVFGAVATLAALMVGQLGTVFEIANKIVNGFGAPLLAIFILGMFSRRASSGGMLVGGVSGAVWSAGVSFSVEQLALHYYAVVNFLGTMVLCYTASLIDNFIQGRAASLEQLRWTWRKLRANRNRR